MAKWFLFMYAKRLVVVAGLLSLLSSFLAFYLAFLPVLALLFGSKEPEILNTCIKVKTAPICESKPRLEWPKTYIVPVKNKIHVKLYIDIYDVTTSHNDSVYMEVYKPAPVFGSLRAGSGICQTRLLALMILSVSNSLR